MPKQAKVELEEILVRLLDEEMQDGKLSADNIFVQYALQPAVTNIVASALAKCLGLIT